MAFRVTQADGIVSTLADVVRGDGARVPTHGLGNAAGDPINPATKDGQDAMVARMPALQAGRTPVVIVPNSAAPAATSPHVRIAGLNTVKQLSKPADATYADVSVEVASIRWRMGATPTETLGVTERPGTKLRFSGDEVAAVRFIEEYTGSGAVLDVYFGK